MVKISYMPLKCENWSVEGGSGFKVKALINNEAIIYKQELVELSKNNLIEIRSSYSKDIEKRKKKVFSRIKKKFDQELAKKKAKEEVSSDQEKAMREKFEKELKSKLEDKHNGTYRRIYLLRTRLGGFRYSDYSFALLGTLMTTKEFAKLWEEGIIKVSIEKNAWFALKEAHKQGSNWSFKEIEKKKTELKKKKELKKQELKKQEELKKKQAKIINLNKEREKRTPPKKKAA